MSHDAVLTVGITTPFSQTNNSSIFSPFKSTAGQSTQLDFSHARAVRCGSDRHLISEQNKQCTALSLSLSLCQWSSCACGQPDASPACARPRKHTRARDVNRVTAGGHLFLSRTLLLSLSGRITRGVQTHARAHAYERPPSCVRPERR